VYDVLLFFNEVVRSTGIDVLRDGIRIVSADRFLLALV